MSRAVYQRRTVTCLATLTESDCTVVLQQKCDNATLIIFISSSSTTTTTTTTTLLGLVDLSAAFDTVDHQILIQRLSRTYGVSKRSLGWMTTSYLTGCTQYVRYKGAVSSITAV